MVNGGKNKVGKIVVHSGVSGSPIWIIEGPNENDIIGSYLSSVPDLDGDRLDDVLFNRGYSLNRDSVFVHSGATGNYLYTLMYNPPNRYNIAGAHDIDGDGFGEIIVESYGHNGVTGKIYVYSGIDGTLLWDVEGENPFDIFGLMVARATGH